MANHGNEIQKLGYHSASFAEIKSKKIELFDFGAVTERHLQKQKPVKNPEYLVSLTPKSLWGSLIRYSKEFLMMVEHKVNNLFIDEKIHIICNIFLHIQVTTKFVN